MYLLCRDNDFVIYKFNNKQTALQYARELRQIYPNVNYYVKEDKNNKSSTKTQFIARWKEDFYDLDNSNYDCSFIYICD